MNDKGPRNVWQYKNCVMNELFYLEHTIDAHIITGNTRIGKLVVCCVLIFIVSGLLTVHLKSQRL